MQSRNPLEVNILIVVIAQEGSSERASKKLGMARSLTRRVAWLERNIGVKLFGRSTRNVELTGGGKAFRSGVVALPQPRGTRLGPGPVSGADRQRALPCRPLGFNPADTAVILSPQRYIQETALIPFRYN
jgi:hypothetical protein